MQIVAAKSYAVTMHIDEIPRAIEYIAFRAGGKQSVFIPMPNLQRLIHELMDAYVEPDTFPRNYRRATVAVQESTMRVIVSECHEAKLARPQASYPGASVAELFIAARQNGDSGTERNEDRLIIRPINEYRAFVTPGDVSALLRSARFIAKEEGVGPFPKLTDFLEKVVRCFLKEEAIMMREEELIDLIAELDGPHLAKVGENSDSRSTYIHFATLVSEAKAALAQ